MARKTIKELKSEHKIYQPIQKPVLKKGGISYKLTSDFITHGILIPKNYILREHSDGWFQAFDTNMYKFFVRLSPENVNNIINKIEIK